jgi:integrase
MARLTDAAVRAAKPGTITHDIYDSGEPGLCLRVQPSGRRAWGLRIRRAGVQRRYLLGDYPDTSLAEARDLAGAMKKAAARGLNPEHVLRPVRQTGMPTVSEAIAIYMETKQDNRSHGMERRRFALHVEPGLGKMPVDAPTKADIAALLHDMTHKAGMRAEPNRVFTSLSGFWSWVVHQRGYRTDNPMAGMKRPIKLEPSQARQKAGTVALLALDELARLWRTVADVPSSVLPDLVRCMIAVPLRREEWSALRWSEVREVVEDGWAGWALKLPAERMKGGRPTVVPLPAAVAAIVNGRKKLTGGSAYVFSVSGRETPFAGWRRGADTLRTVLASDTEWTPHDIRRSVATALARDIGTDTEIIKRILQHSEDALLGITSVYQKSRRLKEQAEALEAWTALIDRVARAQVAAVVALDARRLSDAK